MIIWVGFESALDRLLKTMSSAIEKSVGQIVLNLIKTEFEHCSRIQFRSNKTQLQHRCQHIPYAQICLSN